MKYLFVLVVIISIVSCDKEEDPVISEDCSVQVIVDRDLYQSTTVDYLIDSIGISGDCLQIDLNDSGCDGNSWIVKLIDSGDIAESSPPQRFLKFSFENMEECDAVISKSFYYDLTPLQTEEDQFILNIEGWDVSVLYEY